MDVTTATATNAGVGSGIRRGALLGNFLLNLREYRRRQRDYRHLLDLPDYLLKDIGVTRQRLVEARRRRFF